jgi:hypothetical protein
LPSPAKSHLQIQLPRLARPEAHLMDASD